MKADALLADITRLIVRCIDPEEVVLFGSVAKGTAGLRSDIDILVLGRFSGVRHRRGNELRGLLDRFGVRVDLHLLTPSEAAAEARRANSWMDTLRSSAVTLYTRTPKKEKTPG